MDRYQASVLNRLTAKGPCWTILALIIMHWRWIGMTFATAMLWAGIASVQAASFP